MRFQREAEICLVGFGAIVIGATLRALAVGDTLMAQLLGVGAAAIVGLVVGLRDRHGV